MKLEQPPLIAVPTQTFDGVLSQKFDDFLDGMDTRYLYWDEIKHRKDSPFGKDAPATWALVKANRRKHYKTVGLGRYVFNYYLTSQLQKELHEFDLKLVGGLHQSRATEGEDREYLERSLIEEAIASSQIEGAATTTRVAWDMLKNKRKPRNESEQMIFNNLRAIRFITDSVHAPIDKAMLVELHRIMTADTSAEDCAGDYRKDQIYVLDHADGEVAHIPPGWEEVEELMEALYVFADKEKEFIHPIAKASMIHFFIGFIHPFKAGNGRTARALFYWYLLKKEYALVKNISISRVILESRVQYDKAFLKTEYDENDLTYFLMYSMKSVRVAFENLVRYRDGKRKERDEKNALAYRLLQKGLSKRQADLVAYLYVKKDHRVPMAAYARKHDIVRQTARKDLSDLVEKGLLTEGKAGRNIVFGMSSKAAVEDYLRK